MLLLDRLLKELVRVARTNTGPAIDFQSVSHATTRHTDVKFTLDSDAFSLCRYGVGVGRCRIGNGNADDKLTAFAGAIAGDADTALVQIDQLTDERETDAE